jgi:probable HAF family extracellular repeat protein
MTIRKRLCCLIVCLLAFLPAVAGAAAPRYRIVDLGSLRGFTNIEPKAINDNVQIVGNMVTHDNQLHGFLWKDGRFTDLGPGDATQIDRAGQVLVNNLSESYLWDDSVLVPLGEMTSQDNEADALNDRGDVAGVVTNLARLSGVYVWRNYETHRIPLDWPSNVPGVFWTTSVVAINNQDEIIGRAVPPESDLQYLYLYANGKKTLILPAGASKAWPAAINNLGWVLGEAKVTNKETYYAFIWRNGKVTRIGPVSENEGETAIAMDDSGQVIGDLDVTTFTSPTAANISTTPYFWQDGHRYVLKKLIVNGAGWTDMDVIAMNNRGDIVGTGSYQGHPQAFLLTPANGGK